MKSGWGGEAMPPLVSVGRVKPLFEHHVHPAAKEAFPELGQIESHLRIKK